jgi:hypothetical protein
MHNFNVAIINGSYMFQLQIMFMWELQKEIIYLKFTYSYKWLVEGIMALHMKACYFYT